MLEELQFRNLNFNFVNIPGAAQLVRMFTKTHVASKLRKIWKISGHFWNALAILHLIEDKNQYILTWNNA